MADYVIKDTTLSDIANAIRSKTGKTGQIRTDAMKDEIMSISSGGSGEEDTYILYNGLKCTNEVGDKSVVSFYKLDGDFVDIYGYISTSYPSGGGNSSTYFISFEGLPYPPSAYTSGGQAGGAYYTGNSLYRTDYFSSCEISSSGVLSIRGSSYPMQPGHYFAADFHIKYPYVK